MQNQTNNRNTQTHIRQINLYRIVAEITLDRIISADLHGVAALHHFVLTDVEPLTRLIDHDRAVGQAVELSVIQRQPLTRRRHPRRISLRQSPCPFGLQAAPAGHVLVKGPADDGVASAVQMVPDFVGATFLLFPDAADPAAQFEVEDQRERHPFLHSFGGDEHCRHRAHLMLITARVVDIDVIAPGAVSVVVYLTNLIAIIPISYRHT